MTWPTLVLTAQSHRCRGPGLPTADEPLFPITDRARTMRPMMNPSTDSPQPDVKTVAALTGLAVAAMLPRARGGLVTTRQVQDVVAIREGDRRSPLRGGVSVERPCLLRREVRKPCGPAVVHDHWDQLRQRGSGIDRAWVGGGLVDGVRCP